MSLNKPFISIIIPVYNCEKYVKDCICSVLKQTYTNYEIIIINDGSTDASLDIINAYNNNNFRIINQDNKGLSFSRNVGLNNARGDYVCFLDSDDILSPFFLECLINSAIDLNVDFIGCNYVTFDNNNELDFSAVMPERIYVYNSIDDYLSPDDGFYTPKIISCAKIYKRSLFDSLRFDIGRYHEDEFIIHKIVALCRTVGFINIPYYYYRNNYSGITKSIKSDKKTFDACDAFLDRIKLLRRMGLSYASSSIAYSIKRVVDISNPHAISKCMSLHYMKIVSSLHKHCFLQKFYVRKKISIMDIILVVLPFLVKPTYTMKEVATSFRNPLFFYHLLYRFYYFYSMHIKKCNIAYVGSVIHGNLGDQAIAKVSLEFLKEIGLKPIDIPSDRISDKIINFLKRKKILIVLRGGGNIGNDWLNEEQFHRDIISTLLNNKIIFFPETIHFTDDEIGKKESLISKNIYSKHHNLTIACREMNSYNLSTKLFDKNNSILCPDIVFRLKPKCGLSEKPKSNKVCFVIRNDKEKIDGNELVFNKIKEIFKNDGYVIEFLSTVVYDKTITMFKRNKTINSFLKKLSIYDYIVTDRLHAMIFGFVLNIPCIVLDNSTNKISSSYEWVKMYGRTLLYRDEKQLSDFIKVSIRIQDSEYKLEERYDNLKSLCLSKI